MRPSGRVKKTSRRVVRAERIHRVVQAKSKKRKRQASGVERQGWGGGCKSGGLSSFAISSREGKAGGTGSKVRNGIPSTSQGTKKAGVCFFTQLGGKVWGEETKWNKSFKGN